eukprot:Clim_evm13s240 gene=Clim_evmTU13s240
MATLRKAASDTVLTQSQRTEIDRALLHAQDPALDVVKAAEEDGPEAPIETLERHAANIESITKSEEALFGHIMQWSDVRDPGSGLGYTPGGDSLLDLKAQIGEAMIREEAQKQALQRHTVRNGQERNGNKDGRRWFSTGKAPRWIGISSSTNHTSHHSSTFSNTDQSMSTNTDTVGQFVKRDFTVVVTQRRQITTGAAAPMSRRSNPNAPKSQAFIEAAADVLTQAMRGRGTSTEGITGTNRPLTSTEQLQIAAERREFVEELAKVGRILSKNPDLKMQEQVGSKGWNYDMDTGCMKFEGSDAYNMTPRGQQITFGRLAHELWMAEHGKSAEVVDGIKGVTCEGKRVLEPLITVLDRARAQSIGLINHPGAAPWINAKYSVEHEVHNLPLQQRAWQQIAKPEQLRMAVDYRWWQGKWDPRVTDKEVLKCAQEIATAVDRVFDPELSVEDVRRVMMEEIVPAYAQLLPPEDQQRINVPPEEDGDQPPGENDENNTPGSGAPDQDPNRPQRGASGKDDPNSERQESDQNHPGEDNGNTGMGGYSDKENDQVPPKPEEMEMVEPETPPNPRKKFIQELMGTSPGQKRDQEERAKTADVYEIPWDTRYSYEDIRLMVADQVPLVKHHMRTLMKRKSRRRVSTHKYYGDLDVNRLYAIPGGSRNIFQTESKPTKSVYRISLVIDISLSMREHDKCVDAAQGAVMLMETLNDIPGIEYEVVGFNYSPMIYKAFKERLQPEVRERVARNIMTPRGGTRCGRALGDCLDRLKLTGSRGEKMVIVVTDGDDRQADEVHDLSNHAVLYDGIDVHGIGLGEECANVESLFPPGRGWWLQDAKEIPEVVRTILMRSASVHIDYEMERERRVKAQQAMQSTSTEARAKLTNRLMSMFDMH